MNRAPSHTTPKVMAKVAATRRESRMATGAVGRPLVWNFAPTRDVLLHRAAGVPMQTILQDVRYGIRMLLKNPAFTVLAVLTLALGIGASTAIFSVVNGFLLRPLPGRDNSRLLVVALHRRGENSPHGMSYLDFLDYRSQSNALSSMAGYITDFATLTAENSSDRLLIIYVTGNFFSTLGLQPAMGRLFYPGEGETRGAEPIVVLGYDYWQQRFGGDPLIVGRSVNVNAKPYTVVGVVQKGFAGPYTPLEIKAYFPVGTAASAEGFGDLFTNRDEDEMHVFVQPKPGAGAALIQSSLQVIANRLAREYPLTDSNQVVDVFPERLARPEPSAVTGAVLAATVFLAMVGLVLVITCVNVANLLLVRAAGRNKEMAIRASLGAGRLRLLRQLLTESLILCALGGLAGAVFGRWLSHLIGAIKITGGIPLHADFSFDWRVFACIGGVVVFCGVVVGLAPAWKTFRLDLNTTLREGGRSDSGGAAGRNRLRGALVIAQVAGSVVVLIAAGLFVRSLGVAEKMDLGFQPEGVVLFSMDTGQLGYDEQRGAAFFRETIERVGAMPGVESASFAFSVPMGYYNSSENVWKEGDSIGTQATSIGDNMVDEAYFRTMQIAFVRGRNFNAQDTKGSAHVSVINETMGARLWPGQDPIGRYFRYDKFDSAPVEVVGVVRNSRYNSLFEPPKPFFYLPFAQQYGAMRVLHVRTQAAPDDLAITIQKQIHALEPNLPVFNVMTLHESLDGANGFFLLKMAVLFAGSLGGLCLGLAIVGVYGVISYSASQRTHEVGVRIALGAQRSDILSMVLRQGLLLTGAGLVLGLAISFGATRFLKSLLFQVSAVDPLSFSVVTILLVAAAALACYVPARRATRVDPLVALRHE